MRYCFYILAAVLLSSCANKELVTLTATTVPAPADKPDGPTCPVTLHTDSIVSILYGFPTEASFAKADSGLVYLGGCDKSADSPLWYCKLHDLSF